MKHANNNNVERGTHGDADTLSAQQRRSDAKNLQRCNISKHDKATRAQRRSDTTTQREEPSATTTRCKKDVTQQVSNQQAINQPSQRRAHADP